MSQGFIKFLQIFWGIYFREHLQLGIFSTFFLPQHYQANIEKWNMPFAMNYAINDIVINFLVIT